MSEYNISSGAFADIGASSGEVSFYLKDKFPDSKVIAVDYVPEMLDVINKRKAEKQNYQSIETVLGDINNLQNLNWKLNSFDLIYLWGVLEHCDIANKFKDLFMYLKPTWIIVTTCLRNNLWWKTLNRVYNFNFADKTLLKSISQENGCTAIDFPMTNKYFPLNFMRYCMVIKWNNPSLTTDQ